MQKMTYSYPHWRQTPCCSSSPTFLPELQSYHLKEKDLLQKNKDAIWRRWSSEYQRALLERHRLKYGNSKNPLSVGDVLIFKSEEPNQNCWPLGIVEKLIAGRDGVVRAAKVRTQKTVLERAIQHLYPLELLCDRSHDATPLNPTAPLFQSRQNAAAAAELRILDIGNDDQWTLNLRHSYRLNFEPNISFVALLDQCHLVFFLVFVKTRFPQILHMPRKRAIWGECVSETVKPRLTLN